MTGYDYSIIIPTFNRLDEIKLLLNSISLLNFSHSRFEVLVIDDGSTDETECFIMEYRKKVVYSIRYYWQENQGPAAARNLGMMKAEAPFFIFLDSDVTLPADWLTIIDCELKEKKGDAFGGPDTFRDDFPPLLKAIDYSMTSFFTTGGMRGKKGKKLAKYYPRSFNMGLSRETYRNIGPFRSLRHGQDIEYSHRIIKSGANVLYIDSPVFHKRRTNVRQFFNQVFNFGIARINLYRIDKQMLEIVHVLPSIAFLLFVLFLLVYLVSPEIRRYLDYIAIFGFCYLSLIAICGGLKYKNLKVFGLLYLIAPIQILGYGAGLTFNAVRRVIFRKGEIVGITKSFYGKPK